MNILIDTERANNLEWYTINEKQKKEELEIPSFCKGIFFAISQMESTTNFEMQMSLTERERERERRLKSFLETW